MLNLPTRIFHSQINLFRLLTKHTPGNRGDDRIFTPTVFFALGLGFGLHAYSVSLMFRKDRHNVTSD